MQLSEAATKLKWHEAARSCMQGCIAAVRWSTAERCQGRCMEHGLHRLDAVLLQQIRGSVLCMGGLSNPTTSQPTQVIHDEGSTAICCALRHRTASAASPEHKKRQQDHREHKDHGIGIQLLLHVCQKI